MDTDRELQSSSDSTNETNEYILPIFYSNNNVPLAVPFAYLPYRERRINFRFSVLMHSLFGIFFSTIKCSQKIEFRHLIIWPEIKGIRLLPCIRAGVRIPVSSMIVGETSIFKTI